MSAEKDAGERQLTLVFHNTAADALEVKAAGFMLLVDSIVALDSGQTVARYVQERWEVSGRRFLRVECQEIAVLQFGSDERVGPVQGPFLVARLVDGVLLANQTPMASLHPVRGWFTATNAELWKWIRILATPLEPDYIPLAVGALEAYHQAMAPRGGEAKDVQALDELLDQVAQALSKAAPIYVEEGGARRPVTPAELLNSSFRRGASVLVGADGTELGPLSVRRDELQAAAAILKSADVKFG